MRQGAHRSSPSVTCESDDSPSKIVIFPAAGFVWPFEDNILRLWLNTLLRLVSGTYFLLTSLYCLLAFLPYTFCALIKAPPYAWMPWFVHHQAELYWAAAAAVLLADWPRRWKEKSQQFLTGCGLLAAGGIYLTLHPFLPGLESNRAAYGWGLAVLACMAGLTVWGWPKDARTQHNAKPSDGGLFGYSSGVLVALVVSLIYSVGAHLNPNHEAGTLTFHSADAELALWSMLSHVVVAVAILSTLNLIRLLAAKTQWPQPTSQVFTGIAIVVVVWISLARFLDRAMSFDRWAAQIYAASLALTLVLWGFSLVLPFVRRGASELSDVEKTKRSRRQTVATWGAMIPLTGLALASRSLIGGEDWNGFVASTCALLFWILMSLCIYRLRPGSAKYSATAVIGTLLLSAFAYKGLQATEIFWGKSLGSTDDEISVKFEEYGGRDASFQLAHSVLGNGRDQRCGDLCRILREYTNIRENRISSGVQLVDRLTPAQGHRPNIFIFVIDSMRPDYLGAYSPQQVHYTPNLDALAQDSVVFKNAYTQYAGTTLSEPAIWSGALLLHTHFPQPFTQVNSLQTLARTDGYQTVISYDTVLRELFTPADELVKLDADKPWNQFEVCSTLHQLESAMDGRKDPSQPVLFYTQPMNVHQFAHNDVPSAASQQWQGVTGLNSRITYEVHWVDSCLGQFVSYLKQRRMYDNSIIVVTSDHGDATGEYGRFSHSVSIWPEIMHVPLIVHLPAKMREHLVFDTDRLSTLTDIAPTLYYLLGHRPIRQHPLYGRPLFAETKPELEAYRRGDLLLASDVRAVYGILTADGRYLYVTYDSPAESYLFDLRQDPNAQRNIVTAALKQEYDEEIIEHLHEIADYYGYKPGVGSLLASAVH
jgi:arylsulfatase A-like enzyme